MSRTYISLARQIVTYLLGERWGITPKVAKRIPYLHYADPIKGVCRFGRRVILDFYIDMTSVIEIKEEVLPQHESQRRWLKVQHGMDEYLLSMTRWCQKRGEEVGVEFAGPLDSTKVIPFPLRTFFVRFFLF